MKILKKISLIITAAFVLSGCNIYRQMVIPTPYYPKNTQNQNLGQEVTSQTANQTNPNLGQSVTTVNETPIKTENKTMVQRMPFPEAEYASLAKTGSATVTGYIYALTPSGKKVYARQTRLYLNPVTSYSTQWYNESYLGGAKMSKVDPRLFNYLKFTTSDNNGKFEFLNVPSGSYYLIGVIKCGSECGYSQTKNIRVTKKISVVGSEIKSIDLSKSIQ
jgi:hypothetical protein